MAPRLKTTPLAKHTKPLLRALTGECLEPPPFWLMRQAGRYLPEYRAIREKAGSFLDLCFSPELAAEITLQPTKRYGMDAAILFADILVIPHALGQRVQFREGEGPLLGPLPSIADLAARKENGIHERLAPVYDTVRLVRAALTEETALIGFAGAPWTVATYMVEGGTSRDFRAVKTWALARRQEFEALINLLSDVTAEYLLQQVTAGAEAVQVFDTWAGCLAEPEIRRWVMAPTARIVKRIKASHPGVPVIGFPRGIGVLYGEYVRETGVDAVGLDPSVPVEWAAQALQSFCTVQGNLDPQLLVVGGAPMEAEAKRILNALGGGPFVFNLGHGIVPETPPQHVADLARVIRSWRRQ